MCVCAYYTPDVYYYLSVLGWAWAMIYIFELQLFILEPTFNLYRKTDRFSVILGSSEILFRKEPFFSELSWGLMKCDMLWHMKGRLMKRDVFIFGNFNTSTAIQINKMLFSLCQTEMMQKHIRIYNQITLHYV